MINSWVSNSTWIHLKVYQLNNPNRKAMQNCQYSLLLWEFARQAWLVNSLFAAEQLVAETKEQTKFVHTLQTADQAVLFLEEYCSRFFLADNQAWICCIRRECKAAVKGLDNLFCFVCAAAYTATAQTVLACMLFRWGMKISQMHWDGVNFNSEQYRTELGWQYTADLLGVTFSNAVSKLKAQSSNVTFHWNVAKETFEFELWAFENVTPSGIGCTLQSPAGAWRSLFWAAPHGETSESEDLALSTCFNTSWSHP